MEQQVGQAFRVREFRGYALNFAVRLEASSPHFILRLLQASNLNRQVFFAAAEIDLDHPHVFLAQIKERAPDVLVDLGHVDPLAQIARALILLKPRRTLECLYGECPGWTRMSTAAPSSAARSAASSLRASSASAKRSTAISPSRRARVVGQGVAARRRASSASSSRA